jgi:hypothetical protein
MHNKNNNNNKHLHFERGIKVKDIYMINITYCWTIINFKDYISHFNTLHTILEASITLPDRIGMFSVYQIY